MRCINKPTKDATINFQKTAQEQTRGSRLETVISHSDKEVDLAEILEASST